jgi:hypothetical protein
MANYQAAPPPAAANDPGRTLGLVGMILAIIPCTSTLGLILSIVALILSRRVGLPNQKAMIGIIVGAAWIVISIILNALGVFTSMLQR